MQELKPNAGILELCEEMNHQVWTSAQVLNKGPIKLDHRDVLSSVQTAMIIQALDAIRAELSFQNHKARMAELPMSMFSTGSSTHNKGE